MPYLDEENRNELARRYPETPGELNYIITAFCNEYVGKDPDYARLNAVVGVLESAKLEFYRRTVAPYEQRKRNENGDVGAITEEIQRRSFR